MLNNAGDGKLRGLKLKYLRQLFFAIHLSDHERAVMIHPTAINVQYQFMTLPRTTRTPCATLARLGEGGAK